MPGGRRADRPGCDARQLEQNLAYLQLAQAEGATLIEGGERLQLESDGYYMRPALFIDSRNDMRINREEVFGPIACVIRVRDFEEALATLNDTEYGLTAGIITQSLRHASHFKRRAQTGCVMVNLPTAGTDYHVPFGGRKASSFGPREQGQYARDFYTVVKTTYCGPEGVHAMHDLLMIDGLQYSNWSPEIFQQMQAGGLSAVHATIAYHENARETLSRLGEWNRRFETWPELIRPVRTASDIRLAHEEGRVGIFFGFQNCSPIEDDIALVEVFRQLGVFVMQLTYNNQSLLASGCYEREDNGISRFGRQVIAEMNRVGMLIDMSHSAERSTLEAIELSSRPVIISHANPASFHAAKRNKSDAVLRGIAASGGLLGFSTYPFHLKVHRSAAWKASATWSRAPPT